MYRARVWAVDYRMPPDHPYPTPLDDCLAAYRALLKERSPADVIVGGSSAGGNLAAALIVRARDEARTRPRGHAACVMAMRSPGQASSVALLRSREPCHRLPVAASPGQRRSVERKHVVQRLIRRRRQSLIGHNVGGLDRNPVPGQ